MKKILLYLILPASIVSAVNAGNDAPFAQLEPVVGSQPVVFAPAVEADEFDGPARVSMCDRLNNGVREQYNAFSNRAGEVKNNILNAGAALKQSAQDKVNAIRQGAADRYNQASEYAQAKYAEAKPAVQNRAAQARDAAQKAAEFAQMKYENASATAKKAAQTVANSRLAGEAKRGAEKIAEDAKAKFEKAKSTFNYYMEPDDFEQKQKEKAAVAKQKTAAIVLSAAIVVPYMAYNLNARYIRIGDRLKSAKRTVWSKLGWNKPATKQA